MARRNKDGKFVISASEVGTYTVCPESWRLRALERVKIGETERGIKGETLHQSWTKKYDEFIDLDRAARIVICLLVLALSVFLLISKHKIV